VSIYPLSLPQTNWHHDHRDGGTLRRNSCLVFAVQSLRIGGIQSIQKEAMLS
jgi:hypothetical protein